MVREELHKLAETVGFGIAWGRPEIVETIRQRIDESKAGGEFTEEFVRTGYLGFKYMTALPFAPRTVGVISLPAPACVVELPTPAGTLEAILAPTYFLPRRARQTAMDLLHTFFTRAGFRFSYVHVPHKSLGARLGLTRYGRNNVTYTPESGSHHLLVSFATDADLGWSHEGAPMEPRLLAECEGCRRCLAACPTGALAEDRFMIHQERCLALWSELPGAYPDWVPAKAYNALMGCTRCTYVCPANKGRVKVERLGSLTAGETRAIASWAEGGGAWPPAGSEASLVEGAAAKLRGFGCMPAGDEQMWMRNAAALMLAQAGR